MLLKMEKIVFFFFVGCHLFFVEMGKFMKLRKVMLILVGYYFGRKVIIMKNIDEGILDRFYSYVLVVGIDRYF